MSWKLFEKTAYLGQGAFGDVLKIRCLKSTCLSKDGTCRIVMTSHLVKKAKHSRQKAEVAAGRNAAISNDYEKSLFQDEYYVAKTINVAHLNQKAQFEALNEIETMQTLNSPYIVGYYDSFIDEELSEPQINIIIEYCSNGDLSSFLEKYEKASLGQPQIKYLSENLVWRIFINLCIGLEHMHSKQFIHRDLKTLNIFMTKDNIAKIGDLGCALNLIKHQKKLEQKLLDKQKKKNLNKEGPDRIMEDIEASDSMIIDKSLNDSALLESLKSTIQKHSRMSNHDDTTLTDDNPVGTPYYLAPEIWREKKYSKESDIWALGVILYELLHFKKPFPAKDKEELIKKVYNQPHNKIRSGISSSLQHLVNIMLKKDPSKRPSVEEIIMSDEFQNIAAKQRINLPLMLNKQKILQKIATDQHGDLQLTPFQKALFDREIKRAAKVVQKVEKQITGTKRLNTNQTAQISRARLLSHKNSNTDVSQPNTGLQQKSGKLSQQNSKINKSNSTLTEGIAGSNSQQSFGNKKVPKLNLNQIKFSENLKGVAEIQVIQETTGSKHQSNKKKKSTTQRSQQRSPPNKQGNKSVEIRKQNAERSETRAAFNTRGQSNNRNQSNNRSNNRNQSNTRNQQNARKQSQTNLNRVNSKFRGASKGVQNQASSLVGNKSEVFSTRRKSEHKTSANVMRPQIDIQVQRGNETDRVFGSGQKSDYFNSHPKSYTVKASTKISRQISPKQGGSVFGSNTKTIFAMKVPSHFQKSTSKGILSQHNKSLYSNKQSPKSFSKQSRKGSQTFNFEEGLNKRRNTENHDREILYHGKMDIEDSVKVNETMLMQLSDQHRDHNSRNLVNQGAERVIDDSKDITQMEIQSNYSASSKGAIINSLNRKYVSMRHDREEEQLSQMEEFDFANKSQTVIKFNNIEMIAGQQPDQQSNSNAGATCSANVSAVANKKKNKLSMAKHNTAVTHHRNAKLTGHRSQHISNPNSIIAQPKVTNMNVDKRKYLSKYVEQTDTLIKQNLKKSVTPEHNLEVAKKANMKILARKDSNQNKYEIGRNKRTESVFVPTNTKDSSSMHISPKILPTKKMSQISEVVPTQKQKIVQKKQIITPNRQKAPQGTSSLYSNLAKPVMAKKKSAAANTGQLLKEQPLQKPVFSKVRSSIKITSTFDEKYVKRLGQKKTSLKNPTFMNAQTPKQQQHNYTDNSIHHERQDTLGDAIQREQAAKKSSISAKRGNLAKRTPTEMSAENANTRGPHTQPPQQTQAKTNRNPIPRPASNSSKLSFKTSGVPLKQDVFKKVNLENARNSKKQSLRGGPKRESANVCAAEIEDERLVEDSGDDKTYQPQILKQSKLTFVSNDKDVNTHQHQGPGDSSSMLNKNLTTPSQSLPKQHIQEYTQQEFFSGTAKPPQSIMIEAAMEGEAKDDNQEPTDAADRPLTPGGYLMIQPGQYHSTPPKQGIDEGAKTPGEGTGKRIGRKTFEAFQKFKNAFKMPKSSQKVSSGPGSQRGSKSGADNQNGEVQTPKLEQSDSPELRDKAVKEFQAEEESAAKQEEDNEQEDPKHAPKVQLLDQVGVIERRPQSESKGAEFVFKPMSEERDVKSSFPNDDVEFTSLRHLSYVADESPKFDKFD